MRFGLQRLLESIERNVGLAIKIETAVPFCRMGVHFLQPPTLHPTSLWNISFKNHPLT